MKAALLLACTAVLCGCAVPLPGEPLDLPPFEAHAHAPYLSPSGYGGLSGQAFLRQRGGGVVTCAGATVVAMPSTYYFRFLADHSARIAAQKLSVDAAALSMIERTTCDAQGTFRFPRLARGEWIVVTEVRWNVGYSREGGEVRGVAWAQDPQGQPLLLSNDNL